MGNLIFKKGFGTIHNPDLQILGLIDSNFYRNGNLIRTIEYRSYCDSLPEPEFKTCYTYNERKQMVQERTYRHDTDSLILKYTYEYDDHGNIVKTILDPTYYYFKKFNEEGQLSSYGQIYNNQLRWEWKYEYVDSTRIGLFETYYNDGKDYLKREYRTFKGNKLITITDTSNTITTQTKLYYNDIGLINKIENYESNSMQLGLKLKSYYDIKTKYKMSMTKILIDLVNKIIFND